VVLVPDLHWKLTWTTMWCHQFEFPVNGNRYLNIYFLPKKKWDGEPWMSSWYWLSARNQLPYVCSFTISLAYIIYMPDSIWHESWKILLNSINFYYVLTSHVWCVYKVTFPFVYTPYKKYHLSNRTNISTYFFVVRHLISKKKRKS
jgi:hypothetical protein